MELSIFNRQVEELQNLMIANNSIEGVYGDGENYVDNEDFPITHEFSDQLYMRKMKMKAWSFVISAVHHTAHFWFLLQGRIAVNTNGDMVEHIAPCYESSLEGAKRIIYCLEDCLFINVHKNPTNTKNIDEIEEYLYSFTIEDYNKKNKERCQE